MSKSLSWILDDYPKLRIEHPWLKPAVEKLEAHIVGLQDALENVEHDRNNLLCDVERLEVAAKARTTHANQSIYDQGVTDGIEIAAKTIGARGCQCIDDPAFQCIVCVHAAVIRDLKVEP